MKKNLALLIGSILFTSCDITHDNTENKRLTENQIADSLTKYVYPSKTTFLSDSMLEIKMELPDRCVRNKKSEKKERMTMHID